MFLSLLATVRELSLYQTGTTSEAMQTLPHCRRSSALVPSEAPNIDLQEDVCNRGSHEPRDKKRGRECIVGNPSTTAH